MTSVFGLEHPSSTHYQQDVLRGAGITGNKYAPMAIDKCLPPPATIPPPPCSPLGQGAWQIPMAQSSQSDVCEPKARGRKLVQVLLDHLMCDCEYNIFECKGFELAYDQRWHVRCLESHSSGQLRLSLGRRMPACINGNSSPALPASAEGGNGDCSGVRHPSRGQSYSWRATLYCNRRETQ